MAMCRLLIRPEIKASISGSQVRCSKRNESKGRCYFPAFRHKLGSKAALEVQRLSVFSRACRAEFQPDAEAGTRGLSPNNPWAPDQSSGWHRHHMAS